MFQKPDFVKVEFVYEWMGNQPGTKLTILRFKAEELEKRGTVKILENKSVDEPPKNKMVGNPEVKKSVGRRKK